MPNVEYALASGRSLRHLDVAPMITALRFQPSDFEYAHGWLNHVPSRHRFQFDRNGRVTIDALCGCATLSVRPEQADELHSMFNDLEAELLAASGDKSGVRVTLRRAERLGEVVPRHPHGLAALPPASGPSHDPRRGISVGYARGIGAAFTIESARPRSGSADLGPHSPERAVARTFSRWEKEGNAST